MSFKACNFCSLHKDTISPHEIDTVLRELPCSALYSGIKWEVSEDDVNFVSEAAVSSVPCSDVGAKLTSRATK